MKVIAAIFFAPMIALFYLIFSPIILIFLIAHPFKDIGLTKFLNATKEAWNIVMKEAEELQKPQDNAFNDWFEGKPKRKKGERRDYYGSLDSGLKETYLLYQNMPGHGYDPDKDGNASHIRHPFNPTFPINHDPVRKERLYHDWVYNGQRMVMGREFTMSEWDRHGNTRVNDIFFSPYKVYGMDLMINNRHEHRYLIESWSVAYHEVEYYKELLAAAHAANPALTESREFQIRFQVLSKSLVTLRRELLDAPRIRQIMEEETKRMGISLWDIYFAFRDEKLKVDQCIYFDRENRKARS